MIQSNILRRLIRILKRVKIIVDVGSGNVNNYIRRVAEDNPETHFYLFDYEYKHNIDAENIHLGKADVSKKIPMKDRISDITTAFSVLPMIAMEKGFKESTAAFTELLRITKQGGYLVITTPKTIYFASKQGLKRVNVKEIFEKFGLKVEKEPLFGAGEFICKKVKDVIAPGWIFFHDNSKLALRQFGKISRT